jgi:hypothetical protein
MLVRLMPAGDSSNARTELGHLVRPLAAVKKAHHLYPLLFYFRFEESLYGVSRFSFVLLDLATPIETTLDRRRYGTLMSSAPLASLRKGASLARDAGSTAANGRDAGQRRYYDLHAYTDEKREALGRWATYLAGLEAPPRKPRNPGAPALETVE